MRKKFLLNTITSLLLQIFTILSGFILPRLILQTYGSNINGLVQSVSQFLGLITFMELGVGAVIQSRLYKPLVNNDIKQIGQVLNSGRKFFNRFAIILLCYVVCLSLVYPFIVGDFDWLFSFTLILSIGFSLFGQYYFGILDGLLLNANQKGYIQYSVSCIALIINVALSAFLILNNFPIQLVKLSAAIIFLIKPIFLHLYVVRHYSINKNEKYDVDPLENKWHGVAQHISSVVIDGTDNVVLTSLSTLTNVSIYSVHHSVVYGVKNLFISTTNGFQPALGEYIAKEDRESTINFFKTMTVFINVMVSFLFSVTAVLLVPFMEVYTEGITDANYIQPVFAILLVIANGMHCLRMPFHICIKAAGHYKQTQKCYIIAAIINICASIVGVFFWGLIGVAIGTLIAMLYQTIWMAVYTSKRIANYNFGFIAKLIFVDIALCTIIFFSTFWIKLGDVSFLSWLIMALKVFAISLVSTSVISLVCYRKEFISLLKHFKKKNNSRRPL